MNDITQCDECETPIRHDEKRYVLTGDGNDWRCMCPQCSALQNSEKSP
jgi:hypothetical protein